MITGRDIVILSSIEWDFLWQGPQEIASRLAKAGNRVLYVENTGVRSPKLRDVRRVAFRILSWVEEFASKGVRTVAANLYVCSPIVLPPLGGDWQRRITRRVFLPLIVRSANKLGLRQPIIISFLPTDTAVDLIQLLRRDRSVVVYYCVADFAELCSKPARIRATEDELLKASDILLTQFAPLALQWTRSDKPVHVIPYGVNLDRFSSNGSSNHKIIERSRNNGQQEKPIIGYVGGLHRHLDVELLTAMAQARPDWQWVCMGPAQRNVGKLAALQNVELPGAVPHDQLARHIETFDVGIVPYVRSTFTDTVVPTKINEYLAMGIPVVSTNLPSVIEAYSWEGAVIATEATLHKFVAAIESALALPKDQIARDRRRSVAALADWEARLEQICALIEAAPQRLRAE
jgi:glycosyltransferase involved in cell wall biosynthesis